MNEPYPMPTPPPKRRSNVVPIVLTIILSLIVLGLTGIVIVLGFVRHALREQYLAEHSSAESVTESITESIAGSAAESVAVTDPSQPDVEAPVLTIPETTSEITPPADPEPTLPPAAESSAAEETPVSSSEEDTPAWADYYAAVINAAYYAAETPDSMMYDIYDLNGDDIPELFLSQGDWHTATVTIYTFYDGTGKQVVNGTIGSYGAVLFNENTGILIDSNMAQGYYYRIDWYLDGDTLTPVFSCSDNTGAVENEADQEFTLNDVPVTADEYYAAVSQRSYENAIELGREYTLTDSETDE